MSNGALQLGERISLDKLYVRTRPQDMSYDASFDPRGSIVKKVELSSPGAHNLSIVIPTWHAPEWIVRRTAKKQAALGRNVLYYLFDDRILSSNADRTYESFAHIAGQVKEDLSWSNADRVNWFGTSLGTSILMRTVGGESVPAHTITLVAPAGDLAESLWTGARTQPLRQQFEGAGVSLGELRLKWAELSPLQQARNIHNTDITMYASDADQVIRPEGAYALKDALSQDNHVSFNVNHNLGHYATVLAYS